MAYTPEWFTVEEVADGWTQITEGDPVLPCHMMVVQDGDDALLIDSGLGIDDLAALVEDVAGTDELPVLLTHSHWDHLGALHQFDDIRVHERERGPDGRVAIDTLNEEFAVRPPQFMESCMEQGLEFPDGFDPATYSIEPVSGVGALEPWEEITVGDRTLEMVPIPGHSPGQLAVLDRTAGICHGADVLEPGVEIFAHFQDCDLEDYIESVERLIELRDEGAYDTLTSGHAEPVRGDDLSVLEDILRALERIVDDDPEYEMVDTDYGEKRRYEIGDIVVLTRA